MQTFHKSEIAAFIPVYVASCTFSTIFKTLCVTALSAEPFFSKKTAEHDVTVIFGRSIITFEKNSMCKIDAREGPESFGYDSCNTLGNIEVTCNFI